MPDEDGSIPDVVVLADREAEGVKEFLRFLYSANVEAELTLYRPAGLADLVRESLPLFGLVNTVVVLQEVPEADLAISKPPYPNPNPEMLGGGWLYVIRFNGLQCRGFLWTQRNAPFDDDEREWRDSNWPGNTAEEILNGFGESMRGETHGSEKLRNRRAPLQLRKHTERPNPFLEPGDAEHHFIRPVPGGRVALPAEPDRLDPLPYPLPTPTPSLVPAPSKRAPSVSPSVTLSIPTNWNADTPATVTTIGIPSRPKSPDQFGSILWSMPREMRVARRERVEVRIGDSSVLEHELRDGLKGKGLQNIDKLEVSRLMRVTLVSDENDFAVKPLNSIDQYIRDGVVARWDFDVRPLRSGQRVLRILVSIRMKVEGKDEVIDLPSYEREVHVAVAPIHTAGLFVSRNWQWIVGTIALPFVAWGLSHTDLGKAIADHLGIHP